MPTKFIVNGFEDRVIREDGFYNILLNGKQVGFNLDIRINYYRGLPLSCLTRLELAVDGTKIPENLMSFKIHDKCFSISQLPELFSEYWGSKTPAHLQVFNYGLEPGEHDVDLHLEFRSPYMKFGPGLYGAIDSSCKKRMRIGEGREME